MKGGFQPKSPKKGTQKRRKSNSSSKSSSSKSASYTGGKRRSNKNRKSLKKIKGGHNATIGEKDGQCYSDGTCKRPLKCQSVKVFAGYGAQPKDEKKCV